MRPLGLAATLVFAALAGAQEAPEGVSFGLRDSSGRLNPPPVGHNGHFEPYYYDVWRRNCHSVANNFTARATKEGFSAGIVVCGGVPELDPSWHTANWATASGRTCFYNYGRACCWDAADAPPDVKSPQGRACARWACGAQYGEQRTRVLGPGVLVEDPGPHACAVTAAGAPPSVMRGFAIDAIAERVKTGWEFVEVPPNAVLPEGALLRFSPAGIDDCLTCCARRQAMWSGAPFASANVHLAGAREVQFVTQCVAFCRAAFRRAAAAPDKSAGLPPQ